MTITGSGFGTDESVVSVRLADYANSKFYSMKILSLSDTEIQCGIPGGLQSSYGVEVNIVGQGNVPPQSDTANDFVYELVIESISPTSGAYHGGTLITITGRNFSPNDGENQIFVGNEDNWFCNIETKSSSSITCRMPDYNPDWSSGTQGIFMSSKLIQDAVCEGSCIFTYGVEDTSPSLTAISQASTYSAIGSITLTGTNFDIIPAADVKVVL